MTRADLREFKKTRQRQVKDNVVMFGLPLNWPVKTGMLRDTVPLSCFLGFLHNDHKPPFLWLCLPQESVKPQEISGPPASVSFCVKSVSVRRYEVNRLFQWNREAIIVLEQTHEAVCTIWLLLSVFLRSLLTLWMNSAVRVFLCFNQEKCLIVKASQVEKHKNWHRYTSALYSVVLQDKRQKYYLSFKWITADAFLLLMVQIIFLLHVFLACVVVFLWHNICQCIVKFPLYSYIIKLLKINLSKYIMVF